MDEFSNIDYKKPYGQQNDYRTSSYIAHFQREEQFPIRNAPPLSWVCSRFKPPENEMPEPRSEQKSQYTFKAPDPYIARNPTIPKPLFIKTFDECRLRFAPKPIPQPSSTTSRFHDWKTSPKETKLNEAYIPVAVAPNNSMQVNRTKPGYAKYLDSSATTSNTAYVEYPLNDLGIGSKDHITFYNWKKEKYNVYKTKETQCEKFASASCPKRRREFRCTLKPVPHGGQVSEFKSSFGTVRSALLFDLSHIKSRLVTYPNPVLKLETSNDIYGKGIRTEAYH